MADNGRVAPMLLAVRHQGRSSHWSARRQIEKTGQEDVPQRTVDGSREAPWKVSFAEGDTHVVHVIRHGWDDTVWATSREPDPELPGGTGWQSWATGRRQNHAGSCRSRATVPASLHVVRGLLPTNLRRAHDGN
ncbi:hypothetical protein MRX96_000829 [Rhipicephalus microplus]